MMTGIAPQSFEQGGYASNLEHLKDELKRLDLLIHLRLLSRPDREPATPFDQFKGLMLVEDEMVRLVAVTDSPGDQNLEAQNESTALNLMQDLRRLEGRIAQRRAATRPEQTDLRLARISERFDLNRFEEQCLLICLAVEIDRKYEKLYAYLQDDVTRKSPGVELVLGLLCESADEKLKARSAFQARSRLLRNRLLQVIDSSARLLSRSLKLDDRIASFLLGSNQVDCRLDAVAHLVSGDSEEDPEIVDDETRRRLLEFLRVHPPAERSDSQGVSFYFCGAYGSGRSTLARSVCREMDIPLIVGDVSKMLATETPFAELIWLLGREAAINRAALCLENFESLLEGEGQTPELRVVDDAIRAFSGLTFVISNVPRKRYTCTTDDTFIQIEFSIPNEKTRRRLWEINLNRISASSSDLDTDGLAGKFRLTAGQIRDAVRAAKDQAQWRSPDDPRVTMSDLYAACRAQANPKLGGLARKIQPKFGWQDIVLPPDQLAQLTELCNQTRLRHAVYEEWGFDRKLSVGKGLSVLFTGPPGTGKTMAAEVIANRLNLELYKIDLSQVVSKYIGETEKKLHQLFDEAQASNSMLFFDEADALFGKRSEVKDAHDRYANIEVGYLLQKMEEYDGVAILATNLHRNIDDAFTRRMRFIVDFPFPDERYRKLIWQVTFPTEAPLGDDVDFEWLAREIKLAGGNIKNIALAGAFFAAGEGSEIRMSHLVKAAQREFQKIGRKWNEEPPGAAES